MSFRIFQNLLKMDSSKLRLQKQNTFYEIHFDRKIQSAYKQKKFGKSSREKLGSRLVSSGRGEISYEIAYENGEMKRSFSADTILTKPVEISQFRQSKLPVPVTNEVKSPESLGQLKNLVKSMIKVHVDSFKEELCKISDQNRGLREELQLHSETICKLLDMTTEKNDLIADMK